MAVADVAVRPCGAGLPGLSPLCVCAGVRVRGVHNLFTGPTWPNRHIRPFAFVVEHRARGIDAEAVRSVAARCPATAAKGAHKSDECFSSSIMRVIDDWRR